MWPVNLRINRVENGGIMIELVKFIYGRNKEKDFDAGFVTGNDQDIGITIINADDPNEFLLCCSGPLSPSYVSGADRIFWEKDYSTINNLIQSGIVDVPELTSKIRSKFAEGPARNNCPFGE